MKEGGGNLLGAGLLGPGPGKWRREEPILRAALPGRGADAWPERKEGSTIPRKGFVHSFKRSQERVRV